MKLKVAILDDRYENHKPEMEIFKDEKFKVEEFRNAFTEEEIIAVCHDADGILVNLNKISANVIDSLEKCKVIGRYGIGYDTVDINAASKKGIKVTNVPDYCAEEVSDHIIALFFAVLRNIPLKNNQVRTGKWNILGAVPVSSTFGKKFGIIGYGKTGQALHRKLAGFSFDGILVYDHHIEKKEEFLRKNTLLCPSFSCTLEKVLTESDFISINIPLNEETLGFIGEKEFDMMKKNCILINTARGAIVNTDALTEALSSGKICGAGLDVFEKEPLMKNSKLLDLENVVLTDHCAWYSAESQEKLQKLCASSVKEVLETGKCKNIVNLGEEK